MANEGFPSNPALTGDQILARLVALGAAGVKFGDDVFRITGSSDATKIAAFEVDGFTTGTTRTFTLPDATGTLSLLGLAQTWTATQTFAGIDATSIGATTRGSIAGTTGDFNSTLTVSGLGQSVLGGVAASNATITIARGTGTLATTSQHGMLVDYVGNSAGTATIRGAFYRAGTAAAAFTAADVTALVTGNVIVGAGSTVTLGKSLQVAKVTGCTNNVCITSSASAITGNWFIYDNSGYDSYLGASLIVGSADPGGTDTARINGALTINSATMIQTKTSFTNGAAAAAGTLTNAPSAGNPTKWIPINDNGTTRYIPAW
jgi:hypothetical protein